MRKYLWAVLAIALLAPLGCAKDPNSAAVGLLKAGDRSKALQALEQAKVAKPDYAQTHYLLFVLYQYLVSQGEPAKADTYLQSAIGEYSWIAKNAGIPEDYKDMEGSLKATDKTKTAYEAAYAAVYAR
jgi:Tfp pilus assembly protein PilF